MVGWTKSNGVYLVKFEMHPVCVRLLQNSLSKNTYNFVFTSLMT